MDNSSGEARRAVERAGEGERKCHAVHEVQVQEHHPPSARRRDEQHCAVQLERLERVRAIMNAPDVVEAR